LAAGETHIATERAPAIPHGRPVWPPLAASKSGQQGKGPKFTHFDAGGAA